MVCHHQALTRLEEPFKGGVTLLSREILQTTSRGQLNRDSLHRQGNAELRARAFAVTLPVIGMHTQAMVNVDCTQRDWRSIRIAGSGQ